MLGDFTMHSTGECPREENASLLSQILEVCPPLRYSLSAKACAGILRRAESRGKVLPETLRIALERQSASRSVQESQGGGKGILIQDEHTGALSTQNKQSVLAFEPGIASREGGHCYEDKTGTLRAEPGDNAQAVCYGIGGYNSEGMKSDNPHSGIYEADTARTLDLNGGNPGCNQGGMAVVALENHPNDSRVKISAHGIVQTLSGRMGTGGGNTPMVMQEPVSIGNGQLAGISMKPIANTLDCMHDQQAVIHHTVRRLIPMECERLQGFPDGWTDIGKWTDSKGKVHESSDSARYKALGNSIALPFWFYLLRRISAQYERRATRGSLFSGIGGFELCWERCNGRGTARWASEIEEFPIAVTKKRFGEN